ncbi:MAG: hypothetical protein SVW77_02240 [Candidatus Nanohaloarchaea archaeon]|nr:hypothetical protein [Candidatus Nanohaloarchaea archaeon]
MTDAEADDLVTALDNRYDLMTLVDEDRLTRLTLRPPTDHDTDRTWGRYDIVYDAAVHRRSNMREDTTEYHEVEDSGRLVYDDGTWRVDDGRPDGTFFGPSRGTGMF